MHKNPTEWLGHDSLSNHSSVSVDINQSVNFICVFGGFVHPVFPLYFSDTMQKWTGLSQSFLQECFDQHLDPFSSESRTTYLTSLAELLFNDYSGGNHTLICERSSECIDSSQQSKSISCLTPVFFDRSDNICCLISMISEHSSAQPIVKPAALIYHCPTCSRPPSTILYRTLQHMAQTDTPPCSIG